MDLATNLLQQIDDPMMDACARVRLRCRLAKHLEDAGDYDGACDAMRPLWSRVGERPDLTGLDQGLAAAMLLRAGALTGWIGSTRQIDGAQEAAKNLISEAQSLFHALGDDEMVAEAEAELAYCYWRQGELDEARLILRDALSRLGESAVETRATLIVRAAIVERSAKRFRDALRMHMDAAPLFESLDSHSLKGRFHVGLAETYRNLARIEKRENYTDLAFIEYAAASFHFEQAGHARYQACVENNTGFLYLIIGKHAEAHEHLDRAAALFDKLKDRVHAAQVDETRARVLIAEERFTEAESVAGRAASALGQGGEQWLLTEALQTRGVALARMGRADESRDSLERAAEVAEGAGDLEHAGRVALTIVEELGERISNDDLCAVYDRAAEMLSASTNLETLRRLAACASRALFLTKTSSQLPSDWDNFSFRDEVLRYESRIIEKALRDASGVVSRAAQMLGMKHHNNLVSILNSRHRELLGERKPIIPRRRSIINHKGRQSPRGTLAEGANETKRR